MALGIARFVNLLLTSLLTGNEVGTLAAVHPALHELPPSAHMQAEQAVTRRFGAIMPAVMVSAILSHVPVLLLSRRRATGFPFTLTSLACYAGMLGITLLGNVPINKQTLAWSPQAPTADWLALRARWERFHTIRTILTIVGLSCLFLSLLAEDRPDDRAPDALV